MFDTPPPPSVLGELTPLQRILVIAPGIVAVGGWATHSGPYAWLAAAEVAVFGGYYPISTIPLTYVVLAVPPVLAVMAWDRVRGGRPPA